MTERENPAAESPADGVQDGRSEQADPLPKSSILKAPFDPKTGIFRDNIRLPGDDDLTELRELMKFGWSDQFPAIVDENGVVLVGHRRLKAAKELGIEPVIKKLHFGSGPAADAEQFKVAFVSNMGGKPFTKEDRKRFAEYLYGEQEFTMSRIAEALQVSVNTIHHDLKGFFEIEKPPRPKGGRPKGSAPKEKIVVAASAEIRKPPPTPDSAETALKARIVELEAKLAAEIKRREAAEHTRGFIITVKEYLNLRFCCHSDRVVFLNDEELNKRFDDASRTLTERKDWLVNERAEEEDRRARKLWSKAIREKDDRDRDKARARREARSAAAKRRANSTPAA